MHRTQPFGAHLACALLLLNACSADGASDDAGGGGAGVLPPASGGAGGVGGAAGAAGAIGTGTAGSGGVGGAAPSELPIGGAAGSAMPPTAGAGSGGVGGGAGSAAAGSTAMMPVDPATCPPAPVGASAQAISALTVVNTARLASGAGCVNMVAEINEAAQKHCEYYSMNDGECVANAHYEVDTCAGFTGMTPGDRMNAAGYEARFGGGEVMAFEGDAAGAIASWINSVWHRIPILDPWTLDLGYGGTANCDTIDFGAGGDAPEDTVLVYPYPGQTGVETSFNGMYEGPMPPAPSSGWPSSAPITLYARELVITEHVLTLDGDTAPIEHVWLSSEDPENAQFLRRSVFMYANEPFQANTTYHVKITGTFVGGALEREWTFTTGEASRGWGG